MSFRRVTNRVRVIAEALIFGGMSLGIVYYFGLKNESLLLSALIFGIYLVVSGRISEFKFMDLDVKLKNAENRPVNELTKEIFIDNAKFSEFNKMGRNELEVEIIPRLIRDANKLKILKIVKKPEGFYNAGVLYHYVKYFTHVVFVDEEGIFHGFAISSEVMKKITQSIPPESVHNFLFAGPFHSIIEIPLVNEINSWKLNADPIKKEYVVKGTPRKQVLDKMDKLGLDAIPVVSTGLKYEGFIDRDTIIFQISKEVFVRS